MLMIGVVRPTIVEKREIGARMGCIGGSLTSWSSTLVRYHQGVLPMFVNNITNIGSQSLVVHNPTVRRVLPLRAPSVSQSSLRTLSSGMRGCSGAVPVHLVWHAPRARAGA